MKRVCQEIPEGKLGADGAPATYALGSESGHSEKIRPSIFFGAVMKETVTRRVNHTPPFSGITHT